LHASAGAQSLSRRWSGLGRQSPVVAGVFALFLLSMAGIPLTAGFIGKWAVFEVAVSAGGRAGVVLGVPVVAAGAWPVVLVGVLVSAAAAYFYVRVIVVMYFQEPDSESAYVAHPSALTA